MTWNQKSVVIGLVGFVLVLVLAGGTRSDDQKAATGGDLQGQAAADALMDQWKRNNPDRDWVTEEKERHTIEPGADNSDLLKGGQAGAYTQFTERDIVIWARELEKLVVRGSEVFHDADLLGSSIAVSCDMCHPNAANTHPETYPKFQTQMGRVVLLRDMINWCIEQAVRGEVLQADDANMRALEAYILAQRKGVELNYGKH
jgi:thiosulfate dehydrogenase